MRNDGLVPDMIERDEITGYPETENTDRRKKINSSLFRGNLLKGMPKVYAPEYETVEQLRKISSQLDDIYYLLAKYLAKEQEG